MNPEAITYTLMILGGLAVISLVKEKLENSRFQPPTKKKNPSIEKAKISFQTPESAVTAEAEMKPAQKTEGTGTESGVIASFDIKSGVWANKKAKANQYKLTASMIDKLKYLDTSSFLARTLISTMIPSSLLETMVKKARNDELKPGMIIRIAAGKLTIKKP